MPRIINNKNIRERVRSIVLTAICKTMKPYWFVTFHYREGNYSEDKILKNVNHIKTNSSVYPTRAKTNRKTITDLNTQE